MKKSPKKDDRINKNSGYKSHNINEMHSSSGCCSSSGRRQFLARIGLAGGAAFAYSATGGVLAISRGNSVPGKITAGNISPVDGSPLSHRISKVQGLPPVSGFGNNKPLVCVGFSRSAPGEYMETGWPGRGYDSDASQALYTDILLRAAADISVDLDVQDARISNDEEADLFLAPLKTTLCYVPIQRYLELEKEAEGAPQVTEIAGLYRNTAAGMLEPDGEELIQAARAYIANRRLLAETGCHGVATNCFQPVTTKQMFPRCCSGRTSRLLYGVFSPRVR